MRYVMSMVKHVKSLEPGMRKCTKDGKLLVAEPVKQEAKPAEEPAEAAEVPAAEKTPAVKKTRKRKQAEEF